MLHVRMAIADRNIAVVKQMLLSLANFISFERYNISTPTKSTTAPFYMQINLDETVFIRLLVFFLLALAMTVCSKRSKFFFICFAGVVL